MNLKEAREMVRRKVEEDSFNFTELRHAEGFLDCYKQMKPLVYALENHRTDHRKCPCVKALADFKKRFGEEK